MLKRRREHDFHTWDLLFSGPISRLEFAAPFGRPFGSLWLENGGPENGRKKCGKKEQRGLATKYIMDLLAPKEEDLRPPSS